MKIIKTYLTILALLTSVLLSGQTPEKIKIVKDKIDIIGVWDSYLPENPSKTKTWEFKANGEFAENKTDDKHPDPRSKYTLVKDVLTITVRAETEYKTIKFHVVKEGDTLKLNIFDAKPAITSSVKTILLTRKK